MRNAQLPADPLSRIRQSRTLLDTFWKAPGDSEYVSFWKPAASGSVQAIRLGEMRRRVRAWGNRLEDRGLGRQEPVALILPQSPDLLAAFLAALSIGAVPAILAYPNFKIDPDKYRSGLEGTLHHLGARLTLIDNDFPARLREGIEKCSPLVSFSTEGIVGDLDSDFQPHAAEPDELAFIQHSAGTTGLQKAVALSHRLVLEQLSMLGRALELDPGDRIASWLPLYHDMGLVAAFILPLVSGLPLALQSPLEWVLDPGSFLTFAASQRSSLVWLPNFAFQFMARRIPAERRLGLDLRCLRGVVSCSEPVRAESLDEFAGAFAECGLKPEALATSYAMAENVFAVTQSPPGIAPTRIRVERQALLEKGEVLAVDSGDPGLELVSSGRPLPATAIRVVDDQGEPSLPGRVGEIQIRSRSLFDGYYGQRGGRGTVFQGDWYRSRDSGFLHDGELYVLGRLDDVIIVAGRNIFPEDVEAIAGSHPQIQDGRVVAFAADNPELGTNDLVVVAELRPGLTEVDSEEIESSIRRAIREELDVSPGQVLVVTPPWIIKSTAGKPARSATRAKFFRQQLERGRLDG